MKKKLASELGENIDGMEAEKLKPKAAMISVKEVHPIKAPVPGMLESEHDAGDPGELNDEDLKTLLHHYMK